MGYNAASNAWQSFLHHAAPKLPSGWSILEMGPGRVRRSLVRQWAAETGLDYHFADIRNYGPGLPGFVRMLDEENIGAADGAFDAAVCFQMTHNVRRIWLWLPEVARVVRSGGLVVAVAPITWLTNRYPTDFGRIFPDGWATLLADAGCAAEALEMSCLDRTEAARRHQMGDSHCTDVVAIGRKL